MRGTAFRPQQHGQHFFRENIKVECFPRNAAFCHDYYIYARANILLIQAEKFLDKPFYPVSGDSLADFFPNTSAESRRQASVGTRQHKNNKMLGKVAAPLLITY